MKKILTVFCLLIAGLCMTVPFSVQAFAQSDAHSVSAPNVVAPAQPAAAPNAAAPAAGTTATSTVPASQQQAPSMMGMALPFIVMLGIMYFLMIRPQQKRMKQHQSLLSELKNGDEVVTNAGIIGTIAGMSEKVVTLEVAKNVQMKVLKSQVNQVVKGTVQEIQAR